MRLPHPSTVLSSAALFVALSGTGYAAVSIKANSVGSKQIRNHSITASDIKPGAIASSTIKDRSITLRDVAPTAAAELVGDPGATGPVGNPGQTLDVKSHTVTGEVAMAAPGSTAFLTLESPCAPGEFAVGGGATSDHALVRTTSPTPDGAGWTVTFSSVDQHATSSAAVTAICAQLVQPGNSPVAP